MIRVRCDRASVGKSIDRPLVEAARALPVLGSRRSRVVITGCGFGPGFLPLLHSLWITRPQDTLFFWRAVKVRMEIETAFKLRLLLFDGNAMGIGPRILTDASHLPGNLDVGF